MEKAFNILSNNLKPSYSSKHRKIFVVIFCIFLFLFVGFTLIVRSDFLRPFDFNTTVRIQDDIPTRFDTFFSFLSIAGRFEFTFGILLVLLFIKRKLLGGLTVVFFGIAHVIEIIGKNILSQPGPPHMFLRTTELSTDFPGLYIHTQASYPSGHSMRIVFLGILCIFFIFISKKMSKELRYMLYASLVIIMVLMLLSRVSLGEHWTTDVVGGVLLGFAFAFLSLVFL